MALYGLYLHSHWQGSGPAKLLATGSRAATEHVADLLSTCSFCRPGRSSSYSVGACYEASRVGYARRSAPALPDDAVTWSRADAAEWLRDAGEDAA